EQDHLIERRPLRLGRGLGLDRGARLFDDLVGQVGVGQVRVDHVERSHRAWPALFPETPSKYSAGWRIIPPAWQRSGNNRTEKPSRALVNSPKLATIAS